MGYDNVVTTTAWSPGPGCHGGCGVKLYIKNGKVVKVEGDENHPFSQGRACPRLLALTQYMYHPDRITYPLKRVGARGEGKFERITWDEALDTVEEKFSNIKAEYGPESVLFCQGTGRDIGGPISFLAYSYGSPNWIQLGLAGHSCYTPRLGAMMATHGDYAVLDAGQFSEKRYADPEYEVPKVIIIWGQNPMPGCPDGFFGHWIVDCMKRGSKLIVVDPRWTWFASRSEKFLQIRPGTDGALAMGMINVIISEDLYDQEFVKNWTEGFDDLKRRAAEYPPQKVAAITWIPEADIIAAARLYASAKPAAIQWGVPIDKCPEGSTVAQAIAHLWCLTGNLDVPGGNVIARPAYGVTTYPFSTQEMHELYGEEFVRRLNEKRIGAKEFAMVRNFRGWAQPDLAVKQMLTGDPYPIKACWIQTSNVLGGQAADTALHYEALKKMEFVVVADLFHNPTTMAVADIVLPVASIAEKESFRSWWVPLQVIVPAVEVGECRSDWEINLELAKRFNPELAKRYGSVKDLINDRLKPCGLTYDELKAQGGWIMPPENSASRPYRRYEKGLLRPDGKPGFRTPTGKVEFASKSYEEWGLDSLPYYSEPPESEVRTPEVYKKYPLVMVTGRRSSVYFHSEHRMIPWLRECDPYPIVEIHPSVAEQVGIDDGEWVVIENDRGSIKRKAKVTPIVHPKVISVPHGWWLPEEDGCEPNLFGIWDINCNKLVHIGPGAKSGYGGGAYKTALVRVKKANGAVE
ncbi:MAG: putative molybdopterin oxidoreductase, associated with bss3 [Firmicutes bacterium]|nr:putative molybdopterin oxidoreductase, associated with bss3 [Bacillota bacterium]